MNSPKILLAIGIAASIATTALGQTNLPRFLKPPPLIIRGTLVRVEDTNLTVEVSRPGREPMKTIVAAASETTVFLDGDRIKPEALKTGVTVDIMPFPGRDPLVGRFVNASSRGLSGTIVKIEGRKLTILQGPKGPQEKEATATTDENTKVRFLAAREGKHSIEAKDGSLEDLKPGMRVKLVPPEGTPARILVSQTPTNTPLIVTPPGK